MPNAVNITNITPPRVPMVDPTTGLVSREWFRFFESLFRLTGNGQNDFTLQDLQIGPDADATSLAAVLQTEIQNLSVSPSYTPQLPRHRYGSFYDTTTQTAAVINTAYAITLNSTSLTQGVSIGTPTSRVYVNRTGSYNIQFSLQLVSTNAASKDVYIWADVNGTSVPESATKLTMSGSSNAYVAAWNFVIRMSAGDYFRLMWSTSNTNVQIARIAASAPVPAIPSVILTVAANIGE
jgi:hypothetical protein